MITTPALPKKSEKNRCTRCGIEAYAPIVLRFPRERDVVITRCRNIVECDRRVERAKAKAKARAAKATTTETDE